MHIQREYDHHVPYCSDVTFQIICSYICIYRSVIATSWFSIDPFFIFSTRSELQIENDISMSNIFSWFVYLSNRRHEESDSCTLCHESCTYESVTVEVARISIRRTQHLRRFSKLNKGVTDHFLNPCPLSKKSNYRVVLNLTSTDMRESSIRRACSS